jgi:hypothetical protein
MNVQLVDSLVEIVAKLTPEDQELFVSKLSQINIIPSSKVKQENLTSVEKVDQFHDWLSKFPKSTVSLPNEALSRDSIYDDRGI